MLAQQQQVIRERLAGRGWRLPEGKSAFGPPGAANEDTEPVPPERCTWTTSTFFAYWCADLIGTTAWTTVSSFQGLGLVWWQTVMAVFFGGFLLSLVLAVNGVVGARLHTPFPITARATFGYYFSLFPVVSRCIIGFFWLSINTYQGGIGVGQMLTALSPSYANLPNHITSTSGLTSYSFLNFVLFWLIQLPFIFIHPSRLRPLFLAKNFTTPIVAIGTMAWAVSKLGSNAGPLLRQSSQLSGLPLFFSFMTATTASMGSLSTLACNIGDFSRYSKKPTSGVYQVVFMPTIWSLLSCIGAIGSQCASAYYGETLWQPFDIIAKWQKTSGGRAAAFFCSAIWILSNIGSNISANSISAANDLSTLFPRYINIYRGQWIAITIGVFAFAPWKVLSSASNLISFMSSYSIVLAPFAALLAADFLFVKRQKINVPQLYAVPHGIYRFSGGFNWRAGVAFMCSFGPNLPGMINAVDPTINIGGAKWVYVIADLFAFVVTGSVYVALSYAFPDQRSLVEHHFSAEQALSERDGTAPQARSESLHTDSEKGADLKEQSLPVAVV